MAKCILVYTNTHTHVSNDVNDKLVSFCNFANCIRNSLFWKARKKSSILCTTTIIYLSLWRWTWRWISWRRFITSDKRIGHIYRHFTVWTCWTKRVIQFRWRKIANDTRTLFGTLHEGKGKFWLRPHRVVQRDFDLATLTIVLIHRQHCEHF